MSERLEAIVSYIQIKIMHKEQPQINLVDLMTLDLLSRIIVKSTKLVTGHRGTGRLVEVRTPIMLMM